MPYLFRLLGPNSRMVACFPQISFMEVGLEKPRTHKVRGWFSTGCSPPEVGVGQGEQAGSVSLFPTMLSPQALW